MSITGYSERGVLSSLVYEVEYSGNPHCLIHGLLNLAQFPWNTPRHSLNLAPVQNFTILVEQSLSDFGTADMIFLLDIAGRQIAIFAEAKVKGWGKPWTINRECRNFIGNLGIPRGLDSSNLFTQLYHKMAFVQDLTSTGPLMFTTGVPFPLCSTMRRRKIGTNGVVQRARQMIEPYLGDVYYLAIVPDTAANVLTFNPAIPTISLLYPQWDANHFGFLRWEDVDNFCRTWRLLQTNAVFSFNRGQIY